MHRILLLIKWLTRLCLQPLYHRFIDWTKPATAISLLVGTLTDLARSKSELVAENALLRQQLVILRRRVKRPPCTKTDRMLLVLLAGAVRTWNKPCSLSSQRRFCGGIARDFKLYWKYKSRATSAKPKISAETVALIKEMARNNRLWGAKRIRGELLKLGLRFCLPHHPEVHETVRAAGPRGQKWSTFLHTHAEQMWACDFLTVTDLFFRSLFAFFIIELKSRRVIHVGVIRNLPMPGRTTASGDHRLWRGAEVSHP